MLSIWHFKEKINKQSNKLDDLFESIDDPSKKFDILIKLSEYTIPKLQRVETRDTTRHIDIDLTTEELTSIIKKLDSIP